MVEIWEQIKAGQREPLHHPRFPYKQQAIDTVFKEMVQDPILGPLIIELDESPEKRLTTKVAGSGISSESKSPEDIQADALDEFLTLPLHPGHEPGRFY